MSAWGLIVSSVGYQPSYMPLIHSTVTLVTHYCATYVPFPRHQLCVWLSDGSQPISPQHNHAESSDWKRMKFQWQTYTLPVYTSLTKLSPFDPITLTTSPKMNTSVSTTHIVYISKMKKKNAKAYLSWVEKREGAHLHIIQLCKCAADIKSIHLVQTNRGNPQATCIYTPVG